MHSRTIGHAVVPLALLASAALAPPAHASTVQIVPAPLNPFPSRAAGGTLEFAAAPGERNAVVIADGPDGSYDVVDGGAPLVAGAGCAQVNANAARCSTTETQVLSVKVDGADLADSLAVPAAQRSHTVVVGGAGDDSISGNGNFYGGAGNDELIGSARRDELWGGPGDDGLRGEGDDDVLSGDGEQTGVDNGGGDDVIDGGDSVNPSGDTVTYRTRVAPVRVDLGDPGPDGSAGERDVLTSVETVLGGTGADVLIGTDAGENLDGGDGDDVVDGRAGDDGLLGDAGDDSVYGGDGADSILATDAGDRAFGQAGNDTLSRLHPGAFLSGGVGNDLLGVDNAGTALRLTCNRGLDVLGPGLAGQRVPSDCEQVKLDENGIFFLARAPARTRRNVITLPARCVRPAFPNVRTCRVNLTLLVLRPGRTPALLGSRRFVLAAGQSLGLGVLVGKRGRAALALRPAAIVEIRVRGRGVQPPKVKIRAPPSVLGFVARWRAPL